MIYGKKIGEVVDRILIYVILVVGERKSQKMGGPKRQISPLRF